MTNRPHNEPPGKPGQTADDRHPRTDDNKHVRDDGAGIEDEIKRKQAVDPALNPGGDPAGAA